MESKKLDATESMVDMLGDRLGSLDPLVAKCGVRRAEVAGAYRRCADASAGRRSTALPREKWRRPPRRRPYPSLPQTLHVLIVTPANAGVQGSLCKFLLPLDSRLHGNDGNF